MGGDPSRGAVDDPGPGEGTGLRPRRDKTRTVHRPQNRSGSPRRALRGGGQCGRVETKRQAVENDRAVAAVTDKAREWESSVELSAVKRASRKSRRPGDRFVERQSTWCSAEGDQGRRTWPVSQASVLAILVI